MVIDWETVRTDKQANAAFNKRIGIEVLHSLGQTYRAAYTSFNEKILSAAKATVTKIRLKNRGWFHHSREQLLSAISARDNILYIIWSTDPYVYNFEALKDNLQKVQVEVTDSIVLVKAAWLAHQSAIIHNMHFSLNEA